MIKSPTVFVLVAGASKELNYPTGEELKRSVRKKCKIEIDAGDISISSGDFIFARNAIKQLKELGHHSSESIKSARIIYEGLPGSRSIDSFIELHNNNKCLIKMAKLAICRVIRESDEKSHLFSKHQNDSNIISASIIDRLSKDNYSIHILLLWILINEQIKSSQLSDLFKNVRIINFNYDRSLEFALAALVSKTYNIDFQQAVKLVDGIEVIRPYGRVHPDLECQSLIKIFSSLSNKNISKDALDHNIKTYSESVDDHVRDKIQNTVNYADKIIFMGFGFHDLNMELFRFEEPIKRKRIYGTCYGISKSDASFIEGLLKSLFNTVDRTIDPYVELSDLTCFDFVKNYSRAIQS